MVEFIFPHSPKKSIICRYVKGYQVRSDINGVYSPKAGDVALFRVKEIGKHTTIQGATGHSRHIFPGDIIEAAFGSRYATRQFEGYVPDIPVEEYHILGVGGAIGVVESMHQNLERLGPTTLELVGYAVDSVGTVINSKFLGLDRKKFNAKEGRAFTTVLSLGSSMDSGKTTTAGFLCRGLHRAGRRPAYMKLTGTVYTKDLRLVCDCGAIGGGDFSNAGFPSTYLCDLEELKDLYATLKDCLQEYTPDVVVIEIADGLLQRETKLLIEDHEFMDAIDHIIFSGEDSMSALWGEERLTRVGKRPFALSGLFTAAPLLKKEVEANTTLPVLDLEALEHIGEHPLVQLFDHEKSIPGIHSIESTLNQVDLARRVSSRTPTAQ